MTEIPDIILKAKETLDAPQDVSKWKNADYKEFFFYMRDLERAGRKAGIYLRQSKQVKDAILFIPNLAAMGKYLVAAEIHNQFNPNDEIDWIFTKAMLKENERKLDEIERMEENPRFGDMEYIKMMANQYRKYLKQYNTQLTDTSYSKIINKLISVKPYGYRKEGLYNHLSKKTKDSKFEETRMSDAITEAMKLRQKGGMFENPKTRSRQTIEVKPKEAEPPTPPAPTKKKKLILKKPKEVAKAAMASVREVVKMEKTPKLKKQFIERVRKELDEFEKTLIPQKELDADMEKARTAVAKARALRRINKAKAEKKEDDKKY